MLKTVAVSRPMMIATLKRIWGNQQQKETTRPRRDLVVPILAQFITARENLLPNTKHNRKHNLEANTDNTPNVSFETSYMMTLHLNNTAGSIKLILF